jgi:hypothetical protein
MWKDEIFFYFIINLLIITIHYYHFLLILVPHYKELDREELRYGSGSMNE